MFLKKYIQFINESRSQVINSDKNYLDLIKEYSPWYLEDDMSEVPIFRGLKRTDDFILINSKGSIRKPVGEYGYLSDFLPTYYDLMMNESNRWKKFSGDIPRKESIFCTNDEIASERFGVDYNGSTYRVIPLEKDTEFIMGFTPDAYGSFTYIDKRFGISMLVFSREGIYKTLKLSEWDYNSLAEMRNEVESIYKSTNNDVTLTHNLIKFLDDKNFNTGRKNEDRVTKEEIDREGGLMNWLEKMFDPELNQFERVKYNSNINFKRTDKYSGKQYSQFELWTNKPCLLINNKFFIDWEI